MSVVYLKSSVRNVLLCCVVTVASGDYRNALQLTVENRVMNESMEPFLWDSVVVYYWVSKISDI
jgi:hypothetical protein